MPRYCIKFKKDFKYMDEIDEIEFVFTDKYISLLPYLKRYPNKTFILYVSEEYLSESNFEKIADLRKKFPSIKIKIPLKGIDFLDQIKYFNIPFFFNHFCSDWDTLVGLSNFGPTDIYITNTLGFNIIKIHNYLIPKNINIRVIPNIAQSSWTEGRTITSFFIRPEDIRCYEKYVDTFEFVDTKRQNILYEIYAVNRKYDGNLKEIIFGLKNAEIKNSSLSPLTFGFHRVKCDKTCNQGKCNICYENLKLAESIEKNNLTIKLPN